MPPVLHHADCACVRQATTLHTMRRYEEALALHEQALLLEEGRLPPGHPSLILCYNNKACSLNSLGRCDEAVNLYVIVSCGLAFSTWRTQL